MSSAQGREGKQDRKNQFSSRLKRVYGTTEMMESSSRTKKYNEIQQRDTFFHINLIRKRVQANERQV